MWSSQRTGKHFQTNELKKAEHESIFERCYCVTGIPKMSVPFVNGRSRSKVMDAMTSFVEQIQIAVDFLLFGQFCPNLHDNCMSDRSSSMPNCV